MSPRKISFVTIILFLIAIISLMNTILLFYSETVSIKFYASGNPIFGRVTGQTRGYTAVPTNEIVSPIKEFDVDDRKSTCLLRSHASINGTVLVLDKSPFDEYFPLKESCYANGTAAMYGNVFAAFRNAVVDPSRVSEYRSKGGEKLEDVWGQQESLEYFNLLPGYFSIPCDIPPPLELTRHHLKRWASVLGCYDDNNITDAIVSGVTIAIQRYEYANLYHSMTDFYNAFATKLLMASSTDRVNILLVDGHPVGKMDEVWTTLFDNVYRAGWITGRTRFEKLVWGVPGYNSVLNDHSRISVPYLEQFRTFLLSQYGVDPEAHRRDCERLRVLIVWRHDYAAHPRVDKYKSDPQRQFANEAEILSSAKDWAASTGNASVIAISLEEMNLQDQLRCVTATDVLVGMHGAGLTYVSMMGKQAALVEIVPPNKYHNKHFSALSQWRGMAYIYEHGFSRSGTKKTYLPKNMLKKLLEQAKNMICVPNPQVH